MDELEYTGFAEIRGLTREWLRYEITLTAFYYDLQGHALGNDVVTPDTPGAPGAESPSAAPSSTPSTLQLKLREAPHIDLRVYIIPRELPHETPDVPALPITLRINKQHITLLEETHPVNRWNGIELRYDIHGQHISTNHFTGAV